MIINRKTRKVKKIRIKNAYRILKLNFLSENRIIIGVISYKFTPNDVFGLRRPKTLVFTREFMEKVWF
jgi:hypothetical protein